MEALIQFCIRHRALTIFGVLLVGVLGVRAAQLLPIDAIPDVTNIQVQVLTNAPALGPVEVEQYVTVPVETAMSGLPGVEQVRSLSRFGLSAVTVVFEEGTDIARARQWVSERLPEAREGIPAGYGSPEMAPISSGLGEIVQFEVGSHRPCEPGSPSADCHSLMDLREVLDRIIAPQLRRVRDVVEVNAYGGELKTWEVRLQPSRLNALGISLREVYDALEANNASAGGGAIVRGREQLSVRGEGQIASLADVGAIRVATASDGVPILIRDVAEVVFAPMQRQGAVTRDGNGEVVTGVVMMLMGANSRQVSIDVKERLLEVQGALPDGIFIDIYYDRSTLVDRTIRTVATNLIEGGVLVIVVLLLLLGNLRGGLLVAAVIPLSMLATFIAMRFFGVSGNLMSLGALDFGLIVDGAIVVMENVVRRVSVTRAKGKDVATEVANATRQVARPVLFGTAIIMIVYVPILSLRGIEGKMFQPMAMAVLAALGAALILALTFVPAMAAWVYRGGVSEKEPLLARMARYVYEPLLARAMRNRLLVTGLALVALLSGGFLLSRMGAEFIPRLDEGAIALQAVRLPSVSLDEAVSASSRIESVILANFPDEVETVVSRSGSAEIATDPMGVDISDIFVMLAPDFMQGSYPTQEALIEAMEEVLEAQVSGQNFSFSQPIELRTNELISGARTDVVISVFGPDLDTLDHAADAIVEVISQVPGAADVGVDAITGLPSLRIQVDRERAARYGVNASEVLDIVAAIGGHPVGVVFEGQRRFALQVRLDEASRSEVSALEELMISTPSGRKVPLAQVVTLDIEEGPSVINREAEQRRASIGVNVRGGDLSGFVAEARRRVEEEVELPPGYVVTWGGAFENLQEATERLSLAVPMALMLIFLLLYTTFGAIRPTLIIFLNVPIAAVGGVVALWLRDMPLSISAGVGFIALSGIAVLNGVVMVSTIRELQAEGISLFDATEKGARLRLRAVLMTALTDGIGFLPMATSLSAGAEVQRPLATVVIGGLVTATLLTLFVLPAIYSRFGGEVDTSHLVPPEPIA